jgi:hypothetical protein
MSQELLQKKEIDREFAIAAKEALHATQKNAA